MTTPWMPLYVADYLADTRRLSTVEHGAYMLLIMEYWRIGGLPSDDRKLARIVGLSEGEWAEIRGNIADLFQDGWKHKRIETELEKAKAKNERRVEAGRRGGVAKAANNPSNATILPEQTPSNALASSSQPQPELEANASNKRASARNSAEAEILIEFEGEFWPAYPNKVGKPDALKSFLRARKSHPLAAIMAGLDFYKRGKPADRSWLNPATFLNQERFNDQPANVNARAGPSRKMGWGGVLDEIMGGENGERNSGTEGQFTPDPSHPGDRGPDIEILEPDRTGRLPLGDRGQSRAFGR